MRRVGNKEEDRSHAGNVRWYAPLLVLDSSSFLEAVAEGGSRW